MKINPTRIINLIVVFIVLFLNYSCNKDSDLLADYVTGENAGTSDSIDLEDGTIITFEDKMVAINVLRDNLSATKRKSAIVKKVTKPNNGKAEIKTDSTIVYTPDKDFTGKDDVTYTVAETTPDNKVVEKENTVVVAVNPVLEVKEDKVETTADKKVVIPVLKNDTFSDKNTATVSKTTPPAKGTVTINKDNTLTYTPNAGASGSDSFTYTAKVENTEKTASTTEKANVTVNIQKDENKSDISMGNELLAFPGAVGFGKNATGGRGGSVIQVTNLNDSGPGSLRAALEAKGTRTVVFRIGGTINLSSTIHISYGNLTIAGQTAPGGGILIKGNMVQVEASNVIIRGIRFRLGKPTSGADVDAFSITAWAGTMVENVIIDHCSFSWAEDENFNIRTVGTGGVVRNVTLQNSIVSECGYGVLVSHDSRNISFYQNLLALNDQRSIRAGYGQEGQFKFEMVNNLIYGWKGAATNPANGQKYTILNNKYKISSEISNPARDAIGASVVEDGAKDSWTYAFIEGNIIPSGFNLVKPRVNPYMKSTPFVTSGLTSLAYDANNIEGNVLNHVGANFPSRDAVDMRIINQYKNGTGTITSSGTYPSIANGTPYLDKDGDGIDDNWETANGLDSKNASDGKAKSGGVGYTNLEVFLHYLTLK